MPVRYHQVRNKDAFEQTCITAANGLLLLPYTSKNEYTHQYCCTCICNNSGLVFTTAVGHSKAKVATTVVFSDGKRGGSPQ